MLGTFCTAIVRDERNEEAIPAPHETEGCHDSSAMEQAREFCPECASRFQHVWRNKSCVTVMAADQVSQATLGRFY
jgi:hypothetical protein